MPNTPPITPCQQLASAEQDQSIQPVTPVYDLSEEFNTGQEVIQLTQKSQ